MDAGIKLNEDVMNQFNEMKICKKGHARKKFIFLHLNSTEEFLVLDESHECQQQRTSDPYQQLLTLLPEKKCCLVIFDFTYDTKESLNKNELVLILWCPNGASMKQKIQFTSTMNMVKTKLSLKSTIQSNDQEDLSIKSIAAVLGTDVIAVEGTSV